MEVGIRLVADCRIAQLNGRIPSKADSEVFAG
jgi:hypothetical protein